MSKKKLSRDGLPIDPLEWTEEDWQCLHKAMEKVKREIRNRHREKRENSDSQIVLEAAAIAGLRHGMANLPGRSS